jgi:hypothetical protein
VLVVICLAMTGVALDVPRANGQDYVVIQAVDDDPENLLWDCNVRKVPFGDESVDMPRCFTFRYDPPPQGIQSAILHVTIQTLGADQQTDSVNLAVDTRFPECDWGAIGNMPGCVGLHGGFIGEHVSLNIDLHNVACDPSVTWWDDAHQAAVNRQLESGVMHLMLQDDTAVYDAQLVLNAQDVAVDCGGSVEPGVPGVDLGASNGGTAGSSPGTLPPPDFGKPEPANADGMVIQAARRMALSGDLIWLPVYLINAVDVANVNFELAYDNGVVTPDGEVVEGNLLEDAFFSANAGLSGTILAGFASSGSVDGTGTVAWVPFRVVGAAGERSPLALTVTTINDPDGAVLDIGRIDGEIRVVSDSDWVEGDCDGNGWVTELDALCALQMSVELIEERLFLDVDGNGAVTSRDATVIIQRAIGKPE